MSDEWRDRATCASVGGDWWFPEQGGLATAAKEICKKCPVAVQCLQYALDNNETEGIWAGTTPMQRRAMKRSESWAEKRANEVRRLAGSGLSDVDIAERMEVHQTTVRRIRTRHGIEGRAA